MSDILFRCSGCSLSLAVSDAASGHSFTCPSCQAGIKAPFPVLFFICPSCSCDLSAPYEQRNQVVSCPNCEAGLRIPGKLILACPACSVNLEVDDEYYRQSAGMSFECPECGAQVMIPGAVAGPASGEEEKEGPGEQRVQQELPDNDEPLLEEAKKPLAQFEPGFAQKTMRLDEFMDDISQADNLKEGKCPYCNTALLRLHNRAFVCKRCNKVIRTVKRTLR